ncbi:CLUMA_CG005407, isoform A [Clunio marinus]|uniref:CLUMA_CG005407, isoform A n=1 Tax=Clunio marinus TaxID=568069 RepID=A0A1J1HUM8_9DIPT|nr:CLUMA_CG005407, isoform A [Clunio marinus]
MEQDDEMPENGESLHPSVIIHVDFDYYYAQVEEVLNPDLKNKPIGIKQRFHIVTCNYKAREFGIKKMELIKDALNKCPNLVIVNGEDLSKYKTYSKRISDLLHTMIGPSERMGLDEHFMDVSKQVQGQISKMSREMLNQLRFTGPFYPNEEAFSKCSCGCENRLMVGSQIAQNIRDKILNELKLTCSVGIAHNKLLAKLVGQMNKPNNQTVLAPMAAAEFMAELKDIRSITGIGNRTANRIEELGIKSISDLQECEIDKLQKKFGSDMATRLKEMSVGCDSVEVKPSGKPKTVGLEDSCRPISIRSDAQEKFHALLSRLVTQIQDDGRIPQSIKVTVRKYDPVKKNSIRETKQCSLIPSHFRCAEGKIQLVEGAEDKIIKNVMMLFDRMVDLKQQFNITLLGLCFSKFQDQKRGPGSIANFLMKKQDVEVQSITNLSNESINGSFGDSFRSKTASPSSSIMDYETMSNTSLDFSGSEESEFEHSPKKRKKLSILLVAKGRRYSSNDDLASPSKLNVSALKLNGSGSVETSEGHVMKTNSIPSRVISPLCISNEPIACSSTKSPELPPNVDPNVWQELPLDVQRELMRSWQPASGSQLKVNPIASHSKSKPGGTLHKYFIRNS